MLNFIKGIIYFSASFAILCIPVSHEPLFNHLHEFIAPVTRDLFHSIKEEGKKGIEEGKKLGKKALFEVTPKEEISDAISSSRSAIKHESNQLHPTKYTIEEKALLEKVLEENP